MSDDNLNGAGPENSRAYFFVGLGALVLSFIAFGLTFSPLGVYSLICAVLLALAALTFLNAQLKKNPFYAVKVVKIVTYIAFFIYLAFFAGGIIYVSLSNG